MCAPDKLSIQVLKVKKIRSHCLQMALATSLAIPYVASAVTIPNSNFEVNTASWEANGGAVLVQRSIVFEGLTRKMGCFTNPTATQPDGYYQGPAIQVTFPPLKANTKYKFSFLAVTNGTTNGKPVDVRSTVREAYDSSNAYRARPYVEQMQPANGVQSFTFSTPLYDARLNKQDPEDNLKENQSPLISNSNIFFMAKPESANAGLGGELCIDDVALEEVVTPAINPGALPLAVQVNQVGYGVGPDKKAIIANALATDKWSLLENGIAVSGYSNQLVGQVKNDGDSGDTTSIANFSSFTGNANSTYIVRVIRADGKSVDSAPFKIDPNQYSVLKTDALAFFYAQRSTGDINMLKYPRYHAWILTDRPAGHNTDVAKCWKVTTSISTEPWSQESDNWGNKFWSGCTWPTDTTAPGMDRLNAKGQLNVSGGWYDAADHGKYVVNGGVALWTLQNQIERLQKRTTLNKAIPDGALLYPANPAWIATPGVVPTANKDTLSDLLNEARYEMEWMLKMQVPGYTTAETGGAASKEYLSTWMTLPIGYQAGKDVDNSVDMKVFNDGKTTPEFGRLDSSTGVKWPTIGVALTPTLKQNVSGMAFHSVHDRYWTGVPQYAHAYNVVKTFDVATKTKTNVVVPADEKRTLSYPTTAATLNLAATAAQCYRIWKDVDAPFAKTCLNASTRAFEAAKANPQVFAIEFADKRNLPLQAQFSGGGAYGDYRVKDEFYWAGIELSLAYLSEGSTTKAATYLTEATNRIAGSGEDGSGSGSETYVACTTDVSGPDTKYPVTCYNWLTGFDWQNTAALGTLSLVTAKTTDIAARDAAIKNIKSVATSYLTKQRDKQGYLFPKEPTQPITNEFGPLTDFKHDYKWGSNGSILNRALILGVAYDLTSDPLYLQGAADAMHYILGRNALGKSYVSGYGSNPLQNPHHRFWGKSGNVEYPSVQPGVLAGGPAAGEFTGMFIGGSSVGGDHFWNKTRTSPGCMITQVDPKEPAKRVPVTVLPTNDTLLEDMQLSTNPPQIVRYNGQRCYSDDIRSFATNEVAVNWNAPLFWVTQFLDGTANAQ